MRKITIWFVKVIMAGIISVALLSVFTMLYSNTGVHIFNKTGATDYKWEPYQYKSNMGEGFSWLKMNDDGFNNAFNLSDIDLIDVLLMGSSHMEAINVPYYKNTGYLLNQMLTGKVTYNIGTSGHTIYHCAKNLKSAIEYYNPKSYIVIETDRTKLDYDMMKQVISGEFPVLQSNDSGILYRIQKMVPCFQPFYRTMKNWIDAGSNKAKSNEPATGKNNTQNSYEDVLDDFIGFISENAMGRKVIIFNHPATQITNEGEIEIYKGDNSEFQKVCQKYGIEFIDMYDAFKTQFETDNKLAHGFINTAVGQGHLNEIGHEMIAESICTTIRGLENGTE